MRGDSWRMDFDSQKGYPRRRACSNSHPAGLDGRWACFGSRLARPGSRWMGSGSYSVCLDRRQACPDGWRRCPSRWKAGADQMPAPDSGGAYRRRLSICCPRRRSRPTRRVAADSQARAAERTGRCCLPRGRSRPALTDPLAGTLAARCCSGCQRSRARFDPPVGTLAARCCSGCRNLWQWGARSVAQDQPAARMIEEGQTGWCGARHHCLRAPAHSSGKRPLPG